MIVNSDIFETIHQLFLRGTFCDVRLTVPHAQESIFCHSVVVCSAIPELKQCLVEISSLVQDDYLTLVLESCSLDQVKDTVNDIYTTLISPSATDLTTKSALWKQVLGIDFELKTCESVKQELCIDNLYHDYQETSSDFNPESSPKPKIEDEAAKRKRRRDDELLDGEQESYCPFCDQNFPVHTRRLKADFRHHQLTHCFCPCGQPATAFKHIRDFETHMREAHKGYLFR